MSKIHVTSWRHYKQTLAVTEYDTPLKVKFSIRDFLSKCDQIRSLLRISTHLLKKSLIENIIFCAVWILFLFHFFSSSVYACKGTLLQNYIRGFSGNLFLVTFTEEILDGILHLLGSDNMKLVEISILRQVGLSSFCVTICFIFLFDIHKYRIYLNQW